jgi:hypothetical protein
MNASKNIKARFFFCVVFWGRCSISQGKEMERDGKRWKEMERDGKRWKEMERGYIQKISAI